MTLSVAVKWSLVATEAAAAFSSRRTQFVKTSAEKAKPRETRASAAHSVSPTAPAAQPDETTLLPLPVFEGMAIIFQTVLLDAL